MRVNANAVLRSWTLLAAFGGSYAPDTLHVTLIFKLQQSEICDSVSNDTNNG